MAKEGTTVRRRAYGEGCLYRRGATWWIKYTVDGRAVYESTKSTKERDAARLLAQRITAVAEGRHVGREAAKLTMADLRNLLAEDYRIRERKSWSRAQRAFDVIGGHFGATRKANTITPDALARYLSLRLEDGAARATVQKELAALRRAFNLACARGLLPHRPAFPAMGEIRNARQEFVEAWEWALVRPELPEYWQDLGDMALAMGWRPRGELRPLTWDRVEWDRGVVTLARYTTKNGDGRVYPFAEDRVVDAALRRRLAYTGDVEQRTGKPVPWVFHVEGTSLSASTGGRFYGPWRRAWRGAFGKDATPKRPHDFRRAAVRNLERAGVSRSVAKKLVGHKTDSMYSRYAITTEDDLRAAVRQRAELVPATVVAE